jgi:hypothetical protein
MPIITKIDIALKMPKCDIPRTLTMMKYTKGSDATICRTPDSVTNRLVVQSHIIKNTIMRLTVANATSDFTTSSISKSVTALPISLVGGEFRYDRYSITATYPQKRLQLAFGHGL